MCTICLCVCVQEKVLKNPPLLSSLSPHPPLSDASPLPVSCPVADRNWTMMFTPSAAGTTSPLRATFAGGSLARIAAALQPAMMKVRFETVVRQRLLSSDKCTFDCACKWSNAKRFDFCARKRVCFAMSFHSGYSSASAISGTVRRCFDLFMQKRKCGQSFEHSKH